MTDSEFDLCRTAAEIAAIESDRRRAEGLPVRPLEGLPVAVEDLEDTAGMRSTYGSTLYADHVAHHRFSSRAAARSRRRDLRQDEHPGVRHRLPHLRRRLRHHEEPLRPDALRRRLERRSDRIGMLAAPVTAVLPFDADLTWPRDINGVHQPDYLE